MITKEEQAKHRAVLIKMLKRGVYRQGESQLRMHDAEGWKYCWAGVACDVYTRVTGDGFWDGDRFMLELDDGSYTESVACLPHRVCEWYGFAHADGGYNGAAMSDFPGMGSLTDDNDHGASFWRIAEIIAEEPHDLLTAAG